jgi:hypothetical protein
MAPQVLPFHFFPFRSPSDLVAVNIDLTPQARREIPETMIPEPPRKHQKKTNSKHSGTSNSYGPYNNYQWKGNFTAATVVKWK